jgi:hypothetical protein
MKAPEITAGSIAKIMEERAEKERIALVSDEERKEYAAALNRIFSSRDGQFLLKKMVIFTGMFTPNRKMDALFSVRKDVRSEVLTELILPYIDKKHFATALME